MNGLRPGFTALKAGAGFGVWDNSAPVPGGEVRWNIAGFIWKLSVPEGREVKEH